MLKGTMDLFDRQVINITERGASLIQILESNLPNVPVYCRYYHGAKRNKGGVAKDACRGRKI